MRDSGPLAAGQSTTELSGAGPLAGWRVIEIGESVAVSFCTRIIADLGAEVLLVEPPGGHVLRTVEPRTAAGMSARFVYRLPPCRQAQCRAVRRGQCDRGPGRGGRSGRHRS
ncbi:CoA transferase [Frankia sp. R82]|uniref:CoA transferase n=1 Tax=Frankia sp. R82 TaxID=2950553 RepID=UPI0035ABDA30